MSDNAQNSPNAELRLESWKEIAAYLQRDVSTVIRWEKHEHLPVHRQHHLSRSSIYAYPGELEAWRAHRKPAAESKRSTWWRSIPAFASTIAIALALMMAGGGPHVGALVQAADGIVTRQVWAGAFNFDGTPSPDGRYLAFDDETGNLAVRDLTTGQTRRLTSNAGGWQYVETLVFSPDGKQVAFGWRSQPDECELRVVDLGGSQPRVLYHAEKQEIGPADWSQDGKSILALRRREPSHVEIVSVAAADGSLSVLKGFEGRSPNPRRLRFSPDGRFVGYDFPADQKGNLDIFVLSVAGGQVTPLVQHPAQEQFLGWTPDGSSVLFLSDRSGSWGAWLVPVADGKPQGEPSLAKRDAGAIEPMGFTREGSFYYKIRDDGLNVYAAALGGGTPSLLVEQHLGWNSQPAWSPDGKNIAYLSRRQRGSADATLCIQSVETSEEQEYSDKLKRIRSPQWSPDGKSLLARGTDSLGNGGLFTINIETEEVTRVPWWPAREYGSWMVDPCWSVDGKAVCYVEPRVATPEGRTRLMRTDLATGRHEVIHLFPETVAGGSVLLSPDGRWFLFWLIRGDEWRPAVMPTGGTESKDLPGPWTDVNSRTLTWAPDSGQILFVKRPGSATKVTRSELWGVPVEGGEQRSLGFSVMKDVQSLSAHPDRKQLAFTAWEPATEVWVMENFLPGSGAAAKQAGQ